MPAHAATARTTRTSAARTSNRRAAPPAPAPAPPVDLTPWRSLKALVEVLNDGAESQTFSVHGVRHLIYAAEDGREPELLPFIRRIGRKLLVSEPGFTYWLNTRPSTRNRR